MKERLEKYGREDLMSVLFRSLHFVLFYYNLKLHQIHCFDGFQKINVITVKSYLANVLLNGEVITEEVTKKKWFLPHSKSKYRED